MEEIIKIIDIIQNFVTHQTFMESCFRTKYAIYFFQKKLYEIPLRIPKPLEHNEIDLHITNIYKANTIEVLIQPIITTIDNAKTIYRANTIWRVSVILSIND